MQPETHIILAFWRRNGEGDVEFFVPVDGYAETMRHVIVGDPGTTAHRITRSQFGIEPRSNARVYRRQGNCVVALDLTTVESADLPSSGTWLPPHLIMDTSIAFALQDVINDL